MLGWEDEAKKSRKKKNKRKNKAAGKAGTAAVGDENVDAVKVEGGDTEGDSA